MKDIIYHVDESIIQYGHINITIYQSLTVEELDSLKQYYYNILSDILYDENFAVVVAWDSIKLQVSLQTHITADIAIYPLFYFGHTIGYELGILNAFCNKLNTISGLKEWAKNAWNENEHDDLACQRIKQKIIKYAYRGENIIYH